MGKREKTGRPNRSERIDQLIKQVKKGSRLTVNPGSNVPKRILQEACLAIGSTSVSMNAKGELVVMMDGKVKTVHRTDESLQVSEGQTLISLVPNKGNIQVKSMSGAEEWISDEAPVLRKRSEAEKRALLESEQESWKNTLIQNKWTVILALIAAALLAAGISLQNCEGEESTTLNSQND